MPALRVLSRHLFVMTVLAFGLVVAAPASAHVSVSPGEARAGAFIVSTVSVPHGCDGSATTKVAIKIPDQLLSVTPTRQSYWTVEKVMAEVDPPAKDAHGNEVTERVDQIVYTAKDPLPDGQRDSFELSFQVPDVAGETLLFPTVQTCEKGETAWVETAVGGGEEPEHPAPSLTVLAAGDETAETAARVTTDESDTLGWVGLAVGALGLVVGGTALVRGRKGAASA